MQESWQSNKADEIQGYANRHDMKNFYDPASSGSYLLLSADGDMLLTDK